VAALAKQYRTYHKKEDLAKLKALLHSQSARSNSMTSADKDAFIDMLIKLTANDSPVNSPIKVLNRYLKP
jgi:hypothetical protein